MTRIDQQHWNNLRVELRMAARSGPNARRAALQTVATQAKRDVAALRGSECVSLQELRELRATLQSAVRVQRQGDSPLRALLRSIAALVGLRDSLGKSFLEVKRLFLDLQDGICLEDKRFLEVLTSALWCVEEKGTFSWTAKHAGKPIFAADDAEFFQNYLQHAGRRGSITTLLTHDARDDKHTWRADVSQGACDAARSLLRAASHRARLLSISNLDEMTGRLETLFHKVEANPLYTPTRAERVTIGELAWVAKLNDYLQPLRPLLQAGLLQANLQDTFERIDRLHKAGHEVHRSIQRCAPYGPGDVLFSHDRKEMLSRGKRQETYAMAAQRWATGSPYMHTSVVAPNNQAVHVLGGLVRRDITLDEATYSDCFQFDWSKLLTAEGVRRLQGARGSFWEDEVRGRYRAQLSAATAPRPEFEAIDNIMSRRKRSVFLPHRWRRADPKQTNLGDKHVFCSEFTAKLLHVVMDRLEDELQEAYGTADDLKPKPMLNPIFSARENFAAAHPGHLLRRLQPFGSLVAHGQLDKYLLHS